MKRTVALLLLLTLCVGLFTACNGATRTGDLTVLFLNTGKSDCILLRTATVNVLIDTGFESSVDRIRNCLSREGVKRIDHMILTHYDEDHIGSAVSLLSAMEVGTVYLPDYEGTNREYAELADYLATHEVNRETVREDLTLDLGGCNMRINPTRLTDITDENNYSLIVSVHYDEFGLLLLGDALKDRIKEYMETDTGSYRVVKLPHHGDYFKKLMEYMSAVRPTYGVICCGPEREVEEKLLTMCDDLGITPLRTDAGLVRLTYNAADGTYRISQE